MPSSLRTRRWPVMPRRVAAMLAILWAGCLAQAVTVVRGPYLALQTPDSMSVIWVTDTACTGEVEWGPTASYGQVATAPAPATRHEIAIGGLLPDCVYHYRVGCAGVPLTADATFRTAPPAGATSLSFSFVGDSCSAPANCTATYNAMGAHSDNGFCVTLGDLAGRGEDNFTDYWQLHFFSPAAAFVKQVCMFPCIGNHELYDETATFVYPQTYLDIWSLPSGNSGSEFYYSFDRSHAHVAAIDTFSTSYVAGSTQHAWLADDLAATDRTWKIVFGHDGAYISEDGVSHGSTAMRTHLVPLFEQNGVDLYLHGHYHQYQRNEVNGVCYIDQGTGGQPWSGKQADDSQAYVRAYAHETYCFTRLDIEGNRLLGRCLRTADGVVLDGYELDKPPIARPWCDQFPGSGAQLNWIATWNFESKCGLLAWSGNPSGDGCVFQVADESGSQFAYPMLSDESLTGISIEAQIHYDADVTGPTRCGIGVRGRQFFDAQRRSYYALLLVRNDALAADGHVVLVLHQAEVDTVLGDWACADASGWHKLKLAAWGSSLAVWIDDVSKTPTPVTSTALAKGRPFIYNFRASGGPATLADDVVIGFPVAPALITDFEGYADGTQVLFRPPTYSGSTNIHVAAAPDACGVVTAGAFGGTKVCQADWAFVDAGPQRWLRLTTSNVANVPNPAVDLRRPIRFRCRLLSPGSLRVCVGLRETGVDVPIGADGGKIGTIEWVGATAVPDGAPQGVLVSDQGGLWHTLTFDPLGDSVQAFTGDGLLSAPNHMGVLEHVAFASAGSAGPFSVQLDGFEQLPAGDLDGDGDTDFTDFAIFEGCLGGPGAGDRLSGCEWADLDYDDDVDVRDYGRFQRAVE